MNNVLSTSMVPVWNRACLEFVQDLKKIIESKYWNLINLLAKVETQYKVMLFAIIKTVNRTLESHRF